MVLPVYIHYTETNVHLWIYECISMDLRMRIYGSTNVHLWIYECAIVDEQTLRHRNNGAIPLCRAKKQQTSNLLDACCFVVSS